MLTLWANGVGGYVNRWGPNGEQWQQINPTLNGFNVAPSDCGPICGDAVISPGEQCDSSDNPGGYGECNPDCTRGKYCGDGVTNGPEGCDDGTNLSAYGAGGCAPGCNPAARCGDALVQGEFGEQCDDGLNNGAYDTCAPGCLLGPRCGGGETQPTYEECDSGADCTATCKSEVPS